MQTPSAFSQETCLKSILLGLITQKGILHSCNEITVRLTIPHTSNSVWWDPTVRAGYMLIPITVRRGSPRGSVSTPADGVLLVGKWGDNDLGTCQHGDQCSGCPASMPNLARPWRLCPGMIQGWAAWGPMPAGKSYSARDSGVSNSKGGKGLCALCAAVF